MSKDEFDSAVRVIESCSGFTESDTPAGEAWEVVLARIAHLESIVSSLPHIDGKPVTPGTMLYSRLPDGSIGISWADMTESDEPVVHGDTNGYAPLDFDGFYLEDPTAAEAARTQEQEKTR